MSVKTTQPVQAQNTSAHTSEIAVIDAPIVAFKVLKHLQEFPDIMALASAGFDRPETLSGSTYRVITPRSEHPLYVTVNDLILNPGSDAEMHYPWEIFVNTRNMDHFMWITSLNQIISGVFDKPAPLGERLRELYGLFDQRNNHLKQGGRFTPTLASEIGEAIFAHFKKIGLPDVEYEQKNATATVQTLHTAESSTSQLSVNRNGAGEKVVDTRRETSSEHNSEEGENKQAV
ncbi:hypothetical protein [Aliamphritea ceti]|uniref:hypothetical protein n=1 Tax=Aliamphritea ceti TaxID=1524258 RepID=UPI0021C2D628|nr:hypothetical protein [Aliamphritea ceti]